MQVRAQQQCKKVSVPSTTEPVTTAVARERRRTGSPAIMAGVVCGALLVFAIAYSSGGGSALRTTIHPATVALERVSDAETVRSVRLQEALGWVHGLAAGLIPSIRRYVTAGSAGPKDGQGRHIRLVRSQRGGDFGLTATSGDSGPDRRPGTAALPGSPEHDTYELYEGLGDFIEDAEAVVPVDAVSFIMLQEARLSSCGSPSRLALSGPAPQAACSGAVEAEPADVSLVFRWWIGP